MHLNDLFRRHDIDPATVLVLRHRPFVPALRKVLPRLAAERPAIFNAYQQTQQGVQTESAMRCADFVAAFIGHVPRKAMFVGLYRRGASHPLNGEQYWSRPEYIEMKRFGIQGFDGSRESVLWFDLELTEFYASWKGRLIVGWPGLCRRSLRRAEHPRPLARLRRDGTWRQCRASPPQPDGLPLLHP